MRKSSTSVQPFFSLFIMFLCSGTYAHSQTDEPKRNPYILTKNSFSIGLMEGVNTSQFTPIIGSMPPTFAVGLIHKLNFDYTFSLGDHFSFGLGTGFGFFPFTANFDENPPFESSKSWGPFSIIDYNVFADLRALLSYQHWLSPKYGIHGSFGGGALKPLPLGSTMSFGTQDGTAASFVTNYSGKFNPYISIGFGGDKVLKNDDLLSFGIHYEFHTNELYSGKYYLYNNAEIGTYTNNGNSLNISLYYTFTRARKMLITEKYVIQEDVKYRAAKKKFRSEKRYIDPKSMFFSFSAGGFSSRNQVTGDKADFKSEGMSSWIVQLDAEIGWKNNFFTQYAFGLAQHFAVTRVNRPDVFWYSGSNAFISPMISAGFGYRFIAKNNINFLNVSAGLTLSANMNKKGANGSGGQSFGSSNGTVNYIVSERSYTRRHLMPSIYLNLSRDFQLTKSLYLTADYRFNLGFITAYEQEVTLYEQPDLTIPHENSIAIKGTSNAFQVGLKYKFVPKR